jgi:nucleotide-binding universal stress UspA family protein
MAGYERLLLPTDFSAPSLAGLARGLDLARGFGARVMLLFVVEKSFFAPLSMIHQAPVTFGGEGDLLGEAVEDGEKRLKRLQEEHAQGLVCETKVTVAATAAAGILEQAERFRPDLIVVASHGRSGVLHLLLGSTSERVVRHAKTHVLVVRGPEGA